MRAAQRKALEALDVARAAGGRVEAALAGGVLGWSTAVLGSEDEGLATFREALKTADAVGGPEGLALGRANLAALFDRIGRSEEALQAALEGFEAVERLGFSRTYGGELLGWAAKSLVEMGRWDEALSRVDQGLGRSGVGRAAVELHVVGARLETYRGRWTSAREHLRRARELDVGTGRSSFAPDLLAVDAELAALTGRRDEFRAAVDVATALYQADQPVIPALGWAAAVALRGEADAAEEARARKAASDVEIATTRASSILDLVERAATRQAAIAPDPRYVAMADLCRAEAGRVFAKTDPDKWTLVVERFETLGRPYPAAYGRYRLAEAILHARGVKADAASAASEAHATARALGAAPLLHDVELLARHARIDLGDAPPDVADVLATAGFGLTPRESEVVGLLAAGWSNQEIADALFITRKTASVHVSNILAKYGVRNRVEAAAIAQRLGLGRDVLPAGGDGARASNRTAT
jgi:DNA-binding CsgD family transcriptional regulator/tetratricopeptide (TPR) repeat protein